ncbi:hypothetical protein HanXRQr2_Chr09g0380641 [Helianthus annuus]|uniref:Transposase (putative) gypsy type domain-containing protein n=1 Tax=Helianthus annuus TaxID=4232 RepID=A0A9K3I5F8_HELAN|nr:hypothetical protein HanXRQr2_Chr09g0380641 [Helianthus annuus]
MAFGLPPLRWPREAFDGLVRNFKFPDSWDARYPDEGQTAADAPAGYITLFWDFFAAGNFRLPVTKFFLEILPYYKFHISQMHPIGMVRVRHFEFVCRTMHIEPTVTHFRVFHQMHCSHGFYSFVQRASAKKILLQPPKYFHDLKPKFFFIKAGVIPIKMVFRGKEDVPTETIQTPFSENWYQDLKDVLSIALPEKALVGACMSLCWRMNREDKPVYMENGKGEFWGFLALEGGKMGTVPKKVDEELWYLQIVKNFVLPRDEDLSAQPIPGAGELSNLGIGLEKKKRAPAATAAPRKNDAEKAQKAKNVKGEKKGTRHSSDSWCDYVVVSDSLEGLAPAVMKKPKAEPRDTADIPPSNPEDPIDLESSSEPLLKKKAGKRKQTDAEAEGQPAKKVQRKKITRRGNFDAFIVKPVPEKPSSHAEPSSAVNEDLPPSPPRAPINEQLEGTKATGEDEAERAAEAGNPEVEEPVEVVVETEKVVSPGAAGVDAGHPKSPEVVARGPEKGKSAQEIPEFWWKPGFFYSS